MKERFRVKRRVERVAVPELGDVWVREMTQYEYAEWVSEWARRDGIDLQIDHRRYITSLLRRTIVDEAGNLVFGPDDDDFLASLPARITRPIVQCAEELNGVLPESLRDIKKNSGGEQVP